MLVIDTLCTHGEGVEPSHVRLLLPNPVQPGRIIRRGWRYELAPTAEQDRLFRIACGTREHRIACGAGAQGRRIVAAPRRLQRLIRVVNRLGLAFRGAFHPEPADGVPPLADDTPTLTVVLLGWTGGDQWPVFAASPEFRDGLLDPLNRWSKRLIEGVASEFCAAAFYPFGGPPWLDFQSWARKAEPVHRSPLGLLIHPQWGLWHSYRGALGLREHVDLGSRASGPHPCEQCVGRPCLSACPVSAFAAERPHDYAACLEHLRGAGEDCRTRACAARRACPIAPDKRYSEPQAAFHMRALLANRLG